MINRKMPLKVITFAIIASCMLPATAVAGNVQENNITAINCSASISPRSDIFEWRYKTKNGKVYRRLFNCSATTWVGDWIYVCEYAGR